MITLTIYHLLVGYEYQKIWYYNLIPFTILTMVYIRGLAYSRVFIGSSFFISMILHVFFKIQGFLYLMFLIIIMTTNMEILTKKVDVDNGAKFLGTLIEYFVALDG